ncbi:MAG TPA: hypothetical protein VJ831_15455 [Jatrophihabitantaceae bacterium]|nr:hypothetical protein [Jatrophihabitantaceae bacterium]
MTTDPPGDTPRAPAERVDNGLIAPMYVPLTDVDDEVGRRLITMLGRARIAAYLLPTEVEGEQRRLYVAAEERADARAIVAAALRAMREPEDDVAAEPIEPPRDVLEGVDTNAAFDALVADWHVDTLAAVREAERQLRQEDAEWRAKLQRPPVDEPVWLDDDHYVPPPPPPLPRLAGPTVAAMSLLAISILLLGLGGKFGLAANLSFLLGVCGVLVGAYMLVMRLRERNDDDDDGAVI